MVDSFLVLPVNVVCQVSGKGEGVLTSGTTMNVTKARCGRRSSVSTKGRNRDVVLCCL